MIPKVIHYCWFGENELSSLGRRCISSWKKYCPDYKIIEWNEKNYDCSRNKYVREALEAGKWAFVSDYARLDIIYRCGGIYLDVDVELLQNLDAMLDCACFLATETTKMIATGLGFGAEKENENIKLMLEQYDGVHFKLGQDVYDTIPCPNRNTLPFQKMGFVPSEKVQFINEAVIYPAEYFGPMDYRTRELNITSNTVAIHHYSASWLTPEEIAFERKVDEYGKHHSRVKSFFYRNVCEYQMYYASVKMEYIVNFLRKKIIKKRVHLSQKWKQK